MQNLEAKAAQTKMLKQSKYLNDSQREQIEQLANGVSERTGIPSLWLIQVAYFESKLNPNAKNPKSTAFGLFQIIDSTANNYGLPDKSINSQFVYIEKLINHYHRHIISPADLYILNFDPDVLTSGQTFLKGTKTYNINKIFGDGVKISSDTIRAYYNKYFNDKFGIMEKTAIFSGSILGVFLFLFLGYVLFK